MKTSSRWTKILMTPWHLKMICLPKIKIYFRFLKMSSQRPKLKLLSSMKIPRNWIKIFRSKTKKFPISKSGNMSLKSSLRNMLYKMLKILKIFKKRVSKFKDLKKIWKKPTSLFNNKNRKFRIATNKSKQRFQKLKFWTKL
jgi:hypothetical protein